MGAYKDLRRADFLRHKTAQEVCEALEPIAESLKQLPYSEHRWHVLERFRRWHELNEVYENIIRGEE